jgi:serine protease Do
LLNLKGEVIGINILPPRTTRPEGFSLAIPANLALDLTKRLISSGKLERAWLGAGIQDLSAEQARALGLESSVRGALIMDLVKDGPGDQGGLKKGDVVIHFLDKEIHTAVDLQDLVAGSSMGQEVKAVVFRKGSKVALKIKLGKQEESIEQSQAALKYRLGAEVRSLTGPELTQLRLTAPQGVLVVWVDPSGPLHEIGLEQGDIIFQINGRAIRDEKGLTELVQALDPGQWITLLALDYRSGRHGYIQVTLR